TRCFRRRCRRTPAGSAPRSWRRTPASNSIRCWKPSRRYAPSWAPPESLLRSVSSPTSTASSSLDLRVREIPERRSLDDFIQLPWRINAGDPLWVPPLRMSVRTALDREKHPFHDHADVAYFVAEREGAVIGRVAAIVNHRHNEYHRDRVGFFGLF